MKAKINGVELNYELSGNPDKPWLTFSNSLATNLHMWDDQEAALNTHFRILRYDKRGHGQSEPVPGAYSFDDLIADIVGLWDHLGIRKTHFVGLSIGGMTVQGIMLKHPERLLSVVIANSMGKVASEFISAWQDRIDLSNEKGMDPLIEPTMERWFTEEFRRKGTTEAQKIADMIATTSVNGYAGCAAAIQNLDYLDSLGQISGIPVLFIAGAQDAGTPPAGMAAMHANMSGSEYVLLNPAAHISNVERAEDFTETLSTFLAKHC
ncbi:MAG: 3-oxoadipate enol-lactonase 2 [Alphaproteobacteria bacterium MarineAlpha11_Bin1]|nr:MAG: 3-oxoadipate enol-lactonase 2 [Alphaproteobacteria bacterium MarineAlpha11_Bin1]|tara:strand:- start:10359 stop:11153 length:795 start_codon:yes stop_codon:yes gene_type:complete